MSHPVKRIGPSPLDEALDELGMTRSAFGEKYGYSKSYLLRLSQGRQSSLSESIVNALSKEYRLRGLTPMDYGTRWVSWIYRHRSAQTLPNPVKDSSLNPFQRLVDAAGGTARMAALLAVPDTLVDRYRKGDPSFNMPEPIHEALANMKYPYRVALEREMEKWASSHSS